MNSIAPDPRLSIGANNPPEDLKAELLVKHSGLLKLAQELLAAAVTVPKEINDDDLQGKATDLFKKMRTCELALEKEWTSEEAPFVEKVGIIKATFGNPFKELESARKVIKLATSAYTSRKEAIEKRRLEEEAERLRLKRDEEMRKAAQAEADKNTAVKAASDFELLANSARIARAAATSEIEIAEAKIATAKAAAAKAKAEMLDAAANFSARTRDGFSGTEEEKAEKREQYEAALAAARSELGVGESELKTAKDLASKARQEQLEAEEKAREAAKAARTAERDIKGFVGEALRDEKRDTSREMSLWNIRNGVRPRPTARLRGRKPSGLHTDAGAVSSARRRSGDIVLCYMVL